MNMKREKEWESKIEELLSKMSTEEKIGQICQLYLTEKSAPQVAELAEKGLVGSVVLTGTAFAGNSTGTDIDRDAMTTVQNAALRSPSGIPILFGKDVIHGYRTIFPIPLAQAATFDAELVKEAASRMAAEASRSGIQWTYAPMLDLARDARWGRIIESFGEDPYLASVMARASVEGIQGDDMSADDKIVACAKHFVGYGAAEGGRDYNKSEITDYTLRNMYLPAFRTAVDAGIQTFMNNFGDIGGEPCVFSKYLFRDILRDEWGFDGFVVSDWGSIANQTGKGTAETKREAAMRAFRAGIDMEMVSRCYYENMQELLDSGDITTEMLDDAVRNILRVKLRAGLFEKPCLNLGELDIYREDDMAFSKKIAEKCMVLLKNDGNVLPLPRDKKIFVTGTYAYERRSILGNWCPGATDEKVNPFVDCMKEVFGKEQIMSTDVYEIGYQYARQADYAVVAVGENWRETGEGNSMARIELSERELELVKTVRRVARKVVVVVFAGRPLALSELLPHADAILYAWHPGTRGTDAAASILAGDASPEGRLPVSMLRSTGQIPTYYNHPLAQYHYREYRDELPTPLYPFGYGLSYTEFSYGEPTLDVESLSLSELMAGKTVKVKVALKNTGDRDGVETVQVYVRDRFAYKSRPDIELKGYQKVSVEKGGETVVEITLGKNAFGYYPEKDFVIETGDFDILVGPHSEELKSVAFNVKKG